MVVSSQKDTSFSCESQISDRWAFLVSICLCKLSWFRFTVAICRSKSTWAYRNWANSSLSCFSSIASSYAVYFYSFEVCIVSWAILSLNESLCLLRLSSVSRLLLPVSLVFWSICKRSLSSVSLSSLTPSKGSALTSKFRTLVIKGDSSRYDSSVSIGLTFLLTDMVAWWWDALSAASVLCIFKLSDGVISSTASLCSLICCICCYCCYYSRWSSASISRFAWLSSDCSSAKSSVFVFDSCSSNSAISSLISSSKWLLRPDLLLSTGCRRPSLRDCELLWKLLSETLTFLDRLCC